jgi:hypothetical protein
MQARPRFVPSAFGATSGSTGTSPRLLELHLGVGGGYTQTDVTQIRSRILTGWSCRQSQEKGAGDRLSSAGTSRA